MQIKEILQIITLPIMIYISYRLIFWLYNKLEKENNRLSKIIREDQIYEDYSYKTLEGLKAIANQAERLSGQMDYIEKEMADASEHLKTLRQKEAAKRSCLAGHSLETISEDYETYKKEQN